MTKGLVQENIMFLNVYPLNSLTNSDCKGKNGQTHNYSWIFQHFYLNDLKKTSDKNE